MKNNIISLLLLEDNITDRKLVEEMLLENNNKFHITYAEKLSEGIEFLEKNKFDAILLDLTLPDSIGLNSFVEIKIKAPETPIIILTGSIMRRPALRQCLDSANSYLVKGEIDSDSLISTITNVIKDDHHTYVSS